MFGPGNNTAAAAAQSYEGLFPLERPSDLGQRKQIVELYDALWPSLYSYVSRLGVRPHDAEDIIQESFLRLVRHLLAGGTEDNLRGWVFRVAHNLSIDLHRSRGRKTAESAENASLDTFERIDPGPNPEQICLEMERFERLDSAISQLTPQQRHCVLLRSEGLRYREISSVLGISVQRVGELLQRALSQLTCVP